ncbi:aldose epimerase family protein [Streptomyces mangrovisoli]|uniref:Aldose 1-epimerase n=1 Tax=Streptomyces mangrovisoli TaxID=1428628 RepID=A0A1J4NP07_9ACTN|nr:aldose epimerase family protein [Streptomyces mangrovisoli]OIJ64032.1 galactose mutarotase [Streptomyces mangrovisoli]
MSHCTLTGTPFGTAPDGRPVQRWRLTSGNGVSADVLTYGGIVAGLRVPDRSGDAGDIVLGLSGMERYAEPHPFLGALVGRYANRIAHGAFTLDAEPHRVPVTDRGHALHGGPDGFDRRLWTGAPATANSDRLAALSLQLRSVHGDMGFPGTLDVQVTYSLDRRGTLAVDYRARTDRATVVNLTNHSYFNLAGAGHGDVLGHTLELDADAYLPVSPEAIPLGPAAPVAGTPFDFRTARPIGDRIDEDDAQLTDAGGYDHCWVLAPARAPDRLRRAAVLGDPGSGRRMEVWTTEPGIQVYTGNTLDGSLAGADAKPYERHGAVCLETQHFPDSPNRPEYPSTVLRPGEEYRTRTEFRFPHLTD